MIIWILFREKLTPIQFNSTKECSLKQLLSETFNLNSTHFRLRNSRGNIIAIDCLIEANNKKDPYRLELFTPANSFTKPHECRISTANASRHIIQIYKSRILKLETLFKDDLTKQNFNNKINHIENQINFIENRLNSVTSCSWNGSLKKPVLW